MSADFLSAFAKLPRPTQRNVRAFITKFNANPTSSGLNYERIHGARDTGMRSLRIDGDYRAIVLQPERGNVHVLLWADKHDEAYAWATRHECRINAATGALQVYEPQSESGPPVRGGGARGGGAGRRRASGGFRWVAGPGADAARRPGGDAAGGPGDRTANGTSTTMQDRLPVEAYEALFLHLAGESYTALVLEREAPESPVDTDDFGAALGQLDSQSRFAIAHDQLELEAMLNAPLERWRVFLHPSQRRLAERHWNGPVRVLGGAGTGKTVVAMHRARWLPANSPVNWVGRRRTAAGSSSPPGPETWRWTSSRTCA